ncbi:hypothetical protein BCR33DRAFT_766957 [Rhizoclosmatium globosum]|uniref:Uncharacterized protein n=1 Tax=Rhizoclosmatium globosum TaxID=329046 RepID=A0A1Y2C6I4_9FUNG|nr:hypothetical protein BCR33DRAFT_766957 [Rhizoclosmatium globosum]|eukprot:ORY42494.1 hypothetical protein BCR33DRAFT_766957 [Rhizoclosmatium globosum]
MERKRKAPTNESPPSKRSHQTILCSCGKDFTGNPFLYQRHLRSHEADRVAATIAWTAEMDYERYMSSHTASSSHSTEMLTTNANPASIGSSSTSFATQAELDSLNLPLPSKPPRNNTVASQYAKFHFTNALYAHTDFTLQGSSREGYGAIARDGLAMLRSPTALKDLLELEERLSRLLDKDSTDLVGALNEYKAVFKHGHFQAAFMVAQHSKFIKSGFHEDTVLYHFECPKLFVCGCDGENGHTSFFHHTMIEATLEALKDLNMVASDMDLTPDALKVYLMRDNIGDGDNLPHRSILFTEHKPWCSGYDAVQVTAINSDPVVAPCSAPSSSTSTNVPCNPASIATNAPCNPNLATAPCKSTLLSSDIVEGVCNPGKPNVKGRRRVEGSIDIQVLHKHMDINYMLYAASGWNIVEVVAIGKDQKDYYLSRGIPVKTFYKASPTKPTTKSAKQSTIPSSINSVTGFDHTAAMCYKENFMKQIRENPSAPSVRKYLDLFVVSHLKSGFVASLKLESELEAIVLAAAYENFSRLVSNSRYSFWSDGKPWSFVSDPQNLYTGSQAASMFFGDSFGKPLLNPTFVQREKVQETILGDGYQYFRQFIIGDTFLPPPSSKGTRIDYSGVILGKHNQPLSHSEFELSVQHRLCLGSNGQYFSSAVETLITRGVSNMKKNRAGDAMEILKATEIARRYVHGEDVSNLFDSDVDTNFISILFQSCEEGKKPLQDCGNYLRENVTTQSPFYIRNIIEFEAVGLIDSNNGNPKLVELDLVAPRMNHDSCFTIQNTEDGVGRGLALQHILGSDGMNACGVFYFDQTKEKRFRFDLIDPGSEVMQQLRSTAKKYQQDKMGCMKDHLVNIEKAKMDVPFAAVENYSVPIGVLLSSNTSIYSTFFKKGTKNLDTSFSNPFRTSFN